MLSSGHAIPGADRYVASASPGGRMTCMPSGNCAQILKHLGYEWWMFRCVNTLLSEPPSEQGDPRYNALVESLAIHGRNLAYFFHKPKLKKDDWNAEDLGLPLVEPMPQALKDWCVEAHKRIAHLTATRAFPLDSWKPGTIRPQLEERIVAMKRAIGADMPASWIGDRREASSRAIGVLLARKTAHLTGPSSVTLPSESVWCEGAATGPAAFVSPTGTAKPPETT